MGVIDQRDDGGEGQLLAVVVTAKILRHTPADAGNGPGDHGEALGFCGLVEGLPARMIAILQAPWRVLADRLEVGFGIGCDAHLAVVRRHREAPDVLDHTRVADPATFGIMVDETAPASPPTEFQVFGHSVAKTNLLEGRFGVWWPDRFQVRFSISLVPTAGSGGGSIVALRLRQRRFTH